MTTPTPDAADAAFEKALTSSRWARTGWYNARRAEARYLFDAGFVARNEEAAAVLRNLVGVVVATLRAVEYAPMMLRSGDSLWPTCPSCHARKYGSKSIEPHREGCVIGTALLALAPTPETERKNS